MFHLRLWRNTYGYSARLNSLAIFNLSDEPSVHATWSGAGPGRLPGMRRNSKLWSPKRNRYLLDKEILEAFGVPVSEQRAIQCGIQPYAIPTDIPLSDVAGFLDVFGFKIYHCLLVNLFRSLCTASITIFLCWHLRKYDALPQCWLGHSGRFNLCQIYLIQRC